MALPLAEYRAVRQLRESARSRVYEAVSDRDASTVIAKVFDIEDDSDEERVQREFELIRSLDIRGVVNALELRRVGDQLVLLLEQIPGDNLAEVFGGEAIELERFWPIAIQIADILSELHAARVVHRDIKPSNILLEAESERVYLADFGISVLLENERRHIYDGAVFVGTLPYISPEQTGRTSHAIDHRSDLYSLGVTFYELLTGSLPFEGMTPLELIHAHLAQRPRALTERRPELPDGLSRLVMKLLAKAPEHRYQTAAGLSADLRSLQALIDEGADSATFELGHEDLPTGLSLPHQLYGRERERAELEGLLDAAFEQGGREIVAVVGRVGVGKSALLGELEPAVARYGGYMVRGSFGAHAEGPYSGFARAITALFEQLLTESDARLGRWRRLLLDGLGGLAGVLTDISPTLELIIGRQDPPAQLETAEARNRLALALERLLEVVCGTERPLVLVLEDLHAAGLGSVRLLESLVLGTRGPLLLCLTARLDELAADHPVHEFITALDDEAHGHRLELDGLPVEAIEAMLTDTLPGATGLPLLAEIVTRKTGGVPLFVRQLLTRLADAELLTPSKAGWRWDRARVEAVPIPDDAVAMMSERLAAASPAAQDVLQRATCIGTRLEPARLERICPQSGSELTACLYELTDAGLLTRTGGSYHFAHDSIREAAQRELDPSLRRELHWAIGRELQTTLASSDEHLFEIVDHLDAGAPPDPGPALRLELAELELRAGQRALETAAYDLARDYLTRGIELTAVERDTIITRGAAAEGYELVARLHFKLGYVLSVYGQREQADALFTELLGWPLEDHHYAEVIARRIELLWAEFRHPEAAEFGLEALERLGAPIPRDVDIELAKRALLEAWELLRELDCEAVEALPPCEDETHAGILDIITQLKYPTFAVNNPLFLYLVGLHASLVHTYGFHATTPKALGDLAIGVTGALDLVVEGVRLQDLACELSRRQPGRTSVARLLMIGGVHSLHRGRAFAEVIDQFDASYDRALEAGEFDAAAFLGVFGSDMHLDIGTHLRVLERRCRGVRRDVGRWAPKQMQLLLRLLRGLCTALLGPDAEPVDAGEEPVWDLDPERARDGPRGIFYVSVMAKAMTELLLGQPQVALETSLVFIHDIEVRCYNTFYVTRGCVLACVAYYVHRLDGGSTALEVDAALAKAKGLLERWGRGCPTNYGHYFDLVAGLDHALDGDHARAIERLDRAWQAARARGCRWLEGLAAEQLASEFERHGLLAPVDGMLQRAWDAYAAWGAKTKLLHMRETHPSLFHGHHGQRAAATTVVPDPQQLSRSSSSGSLAVSRSEKTLDLEAVLRSVGAMTEELRLDEVIARVLDAALTHVGADHGLLVLDQGGELVLAAEAFAVGEREIFADPPLLREAATRVPTMLVNFVVRTAQLVILDDVRDDLRFAGDPYLERSEARSVLALPLLQGERRLGVLVLENHLTTRGFGQASVATLGLITRQAVSTLENAQLYSALRRSEARWRSLVDGAPDLIALLDERGAVVFRNHAGPLRGIIDEAEDDDEGALQAESATRWREAVTEVLNEGRRAELELEYLHRDGAERWYAVRLAPIEVHRTLGEGGGVVRRNAVAVATDISARKQAEYDKRNLEAQLRQQQRLESVGTLASGVAHEINNPIQGIMNYADLICTSLDNHELVDEFAHEIIHESQRVATIVRKLLAFSRQDPASTPEPVGLDEVVESSLTLMRAVLRRDHITLETSAEPRLPLVSCRAQQIQQVVMNLVTNARDALNQRYDEHDDRKRIEIHVESADQPDWVRIVVSDSGGGIPADVLPRIFDPFFTTKGRDQGTGLGLAVSHGIVQEHGGMLTVETAAGVGTRFSLELPAIVDEPD